MQNYDIKGFITNWSNNEFVNTNELYDFENVSNQTNWQVVTQDETYSFDKKDDFYMNKFECCHCCYIQWVDGREERWLKGWRPDKENK